ncbi:MAG: class I SAM-dependent methyltransferase [Pyrinomonadaceae bacterium MAG19_C2-C3]|nr:class I SAM-dependent methyltransferase [Pyrinomonadaceae bacterium MAG19_C2-C3]
MEIAHKVSPDIARYNLMHPIRWIPAEASSILDVGCNVGELLCLCRDLYPAMQLSGVEVNQKALICAKQNLPSADLHGAEAGTLPFPDASFDCVTCIEVLEHIKAKARAKSLAEMRRVLRPGGRLILRVPHAGLFAFLDANNFRFRAPKLYSKLLRQGQRDAGYANQSEDVVWHHHFTRDELIALLGDGWEVKTIRTGGLLLFPLADIAGFPFYRLKRINNSAFKLLQRIADFDIGRDYGSASFDILLVLERT